ncbi:GPI-anchored wall transfer protein 1 [Tothia fuscella]|uniref:GPI-anchored wall transfer protein n=1 Tax=Tothia fuscella TaxID=1048955 RepID=A0A9P4TYR0_9PEZI|nr:GPI-anchored wall transfer protein 1 [Tothia fuscella]
MDKRKSNNYKALKEAFVSNHSGGTIGEINAVTLIMPASVLLWSVLQARKQLFTPYTPAAGIADFFINCIAILAAVTIYARSPHLLNAALTIPSLALLLLPRNASSNRRTAARPPSTSSKDDLSSKSTRDPFPLKPFVTMYRGGMMVITCIAILAVDFKIFPRRFAKVENWGTSLMDMGVGSFVFAAGTVSARSILKGQLTGHTAALSARLKNSIRHSLPLLVLGIIRLYTVKGVDYAEHVTEYGVHWNFFFTLGFLPPVVAVCHALFSLVPSYSLLALAIGVAHECALDMRNAKLTAFIITGPRETLFQQNREGLFSFSGYLAIFLAGLATGMDILPREKEQVMDDRSLGYYHHFQRFRRSVTGKLMTWSLVWITLFIFSTSYHGLNLRVSRRLANLPYFLWVAAFNCCHLTICSLIEKVCFPDIYKAETPELERKRCKNSTSRLLFAVNRNGLAIFLLANLLTGAVNLLLPTLTMGRQKAMPVLMVYAAILSATALALDSWNISVKF